MDRRFEPLGHHAHRRVAALCAVAALHVLAAQALWSGLAREAVPLVKKPLSARVVAEVEPPLPPPLPPPPPPPQRVVPASPRPLAAPPPPYVPTPEVAVPPTAVSPIAETSPIMPAVEPPIVVPPAPAPLMAAGAGERAVDVAIACPTQVRPEIPRRALQEHISGVVRAEALVSRGAIRDVTVASGPRVYHAAVRAAMLQYRCLSSEQDVRVVQEFEFLVDEGS
ncbi:energy transducer TonB [Caldimonas sp. KR1-144]|uniref:energy transducer TonB n=1 Tax=Caldimonas sp. KR1-144 TaxID=3400911 RepID=UPI003C113D43